MPVVTPDDYKGFVRKSGWLVSHHQLTKQRRLRLNFNLWLRPKAASKLSVLCGNQEKFPSPLPQRTESRRDDRIADQSELCRDQLGKSNGGLETAHLEFVGVGSRLHRPMLFRWQM